jgi:hypothetical protein
MEPKPVQADLRRRICIEGSCACPAGSSHGSCSKATTTSANQCASNAFWNGGNCAAFSQFQLHTCTQLALLMEQQSQRKQLAENSRQNACSGGQGAQQCNDFAARSEYESEIYRSLRQRYEQCRRQFSFSPYGSSFGYISASLPSSFGID